MGWLVKHQVSLDCAKKRVTIKLISGKEIVIVSERRDYLSNVISAMVVKRLVRKGCEAYLPYVLDTSVSCSTMNNICTIKEFSNVFLEELPGLPPDCEVEFRIEFLPGTTPVSIAPYRMAPKDLKELNI